MKTYKNVPFQKQEGELSYSDLISSVKEQLQDSHPDLSSESLTIVADLMCRFDRDVYEANGQFSCDVDDFKMKTYKISKKYKDEPSRNIENYEIGLSLRDAEDYLRSQATRWENLGGEVVDKGNDYLTVCEDTGEGEITFEINEQ